VQALEMFGVLHGPPKDFLTVDCCLYKVVLFTAFGDALRGVVVADKEDCTD
jgi:hypothetical protein